MSSSGVNINISGSSSTSNIILNSNSGKITDQSKESSNAIVLNSRLPKLVKLLAEDSTALHSYLSNPFIKYSTWNMTNMYAEGSYYQLGLLAWLNKEISTYTGPTCPGISNVEMIAQKVIEIKDTPAAPAAPPNPSISFPGSDGKSGAIKVVPFNPTWNVLDTNFQNALTIMDTILSFESNLGIHHSGFLSNSTLKTVGTNRVLHLDFNADVYKQFVPGSFMLDVSMLFKVATNPDNKNVLLPTEAEGLKIIQNIDNEIDKSFAKMKFAIKISDSSGNFGQSFDILGLIIKMLARGHLATATLAKKIRDNPNYPIVDMSGTTGEFLWKYPKWLPRFYYKPDEIIASASALLPPVLPVLGSQWSPAVKASAYEKLESIYGIKKSNMTGGAVSSSEIADGFTLSVPTANMNANLSNALNTLPSNIPIGNTLIK